MLDKTYSPHTLEQSWYQRWEASGDFSPDLKQTGAPYCIMLPPPNVTGSLHMGHAFQHTIMDLLTRYHRMKGDRTLWQPGTDHAGIATQLVVENLLHAENKTRHDLGREAFTDKVWEWKAHSGSTIVQQMRRLGVSVDWSRERFTMDEDLSAAVIEVFVRLYEEGLIYRGQRLINWDPELGTAISDLEVVSQEEQGHLWLIDYPLQQGDAHLTVATTRPETMLGDVAVAVHPEDTRYQHWIGQSIKLPLTDRLIPIIADDYVDPSFGTGCVKITPAHDFNDYEVAKRHQLPLINIFTAQACLNENTPPAYRGLDRTKARQHVLRDLQAQGLLRETRPHKLMVPRGERGGAIIEPWLTYQWFVKAAPLAKPAIEAVEQGHIRFIPENWSKTYFQWMYNIQDWCISRQLWWGHRIPAWYDDEGKIYVGHNEAEVRAKHALGTRSLRQDDDVLDTWFSAGLWPMATLGWPHNTPELKLFLPTNVLVTGFDIIFFWVARMIMMSLKFTQQIPFKEVYITGLIRDEQGQKMSKSKGNVLDPIDIIDGIDRDSLIKKRTYGMMQPSLAQRITEYTLKSFPEGIAAYGTDALRFTFCALASNNRDINFDLQRVAGYRNFCNKLWNAARFVLMQAENHPPQTGEPHAIDRWITQRLHKTISHVTQQIEDYRFDLAAQTLYDFIWRDYCDWYLEFTKTLLYDATVSPEQKQVSAATLIAVLETTLRLAHPFMPFITEEIWQHIAPLQGIKGNFIMQQAFPQENASLTHTPVPAIDTLQTIITTLRTLRSEQGIPPAQKIPLLVKIDARSDLLALKLYQPFIQALAKVEAIQQVAMPPQQDAIPIAIDGWTFYVPISAETRAAERARLDKEIAELQAQLARIQQKLGNPEFMQKAKPEAVAKEQQKFDALSSKLKLLV